MYERRLIGNKNMYMTLQSDIFIHIVLVGANMSVNAIGTRASVHRATKIMIMKSVGCTENQHGYMMIYIHLEGNVRPLLFKKKSNYKCHITLRMVKDAILSSFFMPIEDGGWAVDVAVDSNRYWDGSTLIVTSIKDINGKWHPTACRSMYLPETLEFELKDDRIPMTIKEFPPLPSVKCIDSKTKSSGPAP